MPLMMCLSAATIALALGMGTAGAAGPDQFSILQHIRAAPMTTEDLGTVRGSAFIVRVDLPHGLWDNVAIAGGSSPTGNRFWQDSVYDGMAGLFIKPGSQGGGQSQ